MTIFDEMRAEAKEEGLEEGRAETTAAFYAKHEKIIINWIQNQKPVYEVKSLAFDLGISDERFAELLNGAKK